MPQPSSLYRCHRFPGELINHAAWLDLLLPLKPVLNK